MTSPNELTHNDQNDENDDNNVHDDIDEIFVALRGKDEV